MKNKKNDIQSIVKDIVKLREYVISQYREMDGRTSPETAVIKQSDVAYTYETIIRSMDDLIKPYVNFNS